MTRGHEAWRRASNDQSVFVWPGLGPTLMPTHPRQEMP